MQAFSQSDFDTLVSVSAMPPEEIVASQLDEQQKRRQEFEQAAAAAGSPYTADFLRRVAHRFGIEAIKALAIQRSLAEAAWWYQQQKRDAMRIRKRAQLKAELLRVQQHAAQLEATLETLSSDAAEHLWSVLDDLRWRALLSGCITNHHDQTTTQACHGTAEQVPGMRADEIGRAISVLNKVAADTMLRMGRDVGGRPSNEPLVNWVVTMQNIWEQMLGRKFTYDAHQGEGTTRAFEFCQMLLRPIDPSVRGAQLGTAMRRAIQLSHRGKRSRRG